MSRNHVLLRRRRRRARDREMFRRLCERVWAAGLRSMAGDGLMTRFYRESREAVMGVMESGAVR